MKPKIVTATKSQVECELHENHPLRLIAAEGRRIYCVSGVAWITATNEPIDVFLRPGQTYTVPNGGLVLAEGVGCAHIRVDLPRCLDYSQYRTWLPYLIGRAMRALQPGERRIA